MNSKQIKEAKRGVAMVTFAEERVADFTHTPPKPVDAKHAATLEKANAAIAGLGGKQAIQMAGEHGQVTENLRSDRGDVGAMLRTINGTVAAIAEDTKQPGLMDRFRMPHGNGDTELAAKLDGFASPRRIPRFRRMRTFPRFSESPASRRLRPSTSMAIRKRPGCGL